MFIKELHKITQQCFDLKNPKINMEIRDVLVNSLQQCEDIYFREALFPELETIWKKEADIYKYILTLIYINVATLPPPKPLQL